MIHKKFRFGTRKKNREKKKNSSCSSNISSIWQKEIIHQRKKNIKKYLYPGEGEKICGKNKKLIPLLRSWTVHPSPRKHAFIREKKNTKNY